MTDTIESLRRELAEQKQLANELQRDLSTVYNELMRVAPWSESNDMDQVDEMMCGIGGFAMERDQLQREVAELRGELNKWQMVMPNDPFPDKCKMLFGHNARGYVVPYARCVKDRISGSEFCAEHALQQQGQNMEAARTGREGDI